VSEPVFLFQIKMDCSDRASRSSRDTSLGGLPRVRTTSPRVEVADLPPSQYAPGPLPDSPSRYYTKSSTTDCLVSPSALHPQRPSFPSPRLSPLPPQYPSPLSGRNATSALGLELDTPVEPTFQRHSHNRQAALDKLEGRQHYSQHDVDSVEIGSRDTIYDYFPTTVNDEGNITPQRATRPPRRIEDLVHEMDDGIEALGTRDKANRGSASMSSMRVKMDRRPRSIVDEDESLARLRLDGITRDSLLRHAYHDSPHLSNRRPLDVSTSFLSLDDDE
jgi:hypothetical protein